MKPQEFHAEWKEVKGFVEAVMEARKTALSLPDDVAQLACEHLLSATLLAVRTHFGLDHFGVPNIEVMRKLVAVREEHELRDLLFGLWVDQKATVGTEEEQDF